MSQKFFFPNYFVYIYIILKTTNKLNGMNKFEQDMKEAYEKLEKNMNTVASLFNFKRKGYMGENIMLLDFSPKEFDEAAATVAAFDKPNEHGWTKYKGIDVQIKAYPKNNRLSLIF